MTNDSNDPIHGLADIDLDIGTSPSSKKGEKKGKKTLGMERRYKDRLNCIKRAKEAQLEKNLSLSVKKYHEYLKVMSDLYECEPYDLNPDFFNKDTELPEMFIISQVYWELAKIYDLTPKLQPQFTDCLNQFVLFSNNMPFQVVNAEVIRRYIKRGGANNVKAYHDAYGVIHVASKACYIATECFGENHSTTEDLRQFKKILLNYPIGEKFIRLYYKIGPQIIYISRKHPAISQPIKILFVKPLLKVFSKFSNHFIIRK